MELIEPHIDPTHCSDTDIALVTLRSQNAFTSLERSAHAVRRRRTGALYSRSALFQSQHLHDVTSRIIFDRLLPRLRNVVQGTDEIDGLKLSYCICSDYLSSFLFGYCNGSNYLSQSPSAIDAWRVHYENLMCHEAFFVQETPYLYKTLKRAGIDMLPKQYAQSRKFLERWMLEMATKADRAAKQDQETSQPLDSADEPVVYEAAKVAVEKQSPAMSEESKRKEVASEMFDHICTYDQSPKSPACASIDDMLTVQ